MKFPDYDSIKEYADSGLWTVEMVGDAVKCGRITVDQYKEITGVDYVAPEHKEKK